MIMKHVLLEIYCDCNFEIEEDKPLYCDEIGVNCFKNNCKYLSYTYCPNEIALTGSKGIVEILDDSIGFGGEMEPESNDLKDRKILLEKWKSICRKKVNEAYDEYMEYKNNFK